MLTQQLLLGLRLNCCLVMWLLCGFAALLYSGLLGTCFCSFVLLLLCCHADLWRLTCEAVPPSPLSAMRLAASVAPCSGTMRTASCPTLQPAAVVFVSSCVAVCFCFCPSCCCPDLQFYGLGRALLFFCFNLPLSILQGLSTCRLMSLVGVSGTVAIIEQQICRGQKQQHS